MLRRGLPFLVIPSLLALSCTAEVPQPSPVAAGKADAKGADSKAKASDGKGPAFSTEREPAKKPTKNQVVAPDNLAAAPAGAEKSATGVACTVLTPGSGDRVTVNDSVTMHYTGWATDGSTVETTEGRKTPRTIKVNRTPVKGWSDALQMMSPGEKRRCWIPEDQTFEGRRGAPEGQLVYDLEVIEVMKAPEVPPDVAAPPADATKTASGLAYKVIVQGEGDKAVHPDKWEKVTVDYSGWTTDGKMFDSSVVRGKPATFGLDKVIAGWTEGVQLMAKGDTFRFWIPQDLAYKGQPGKPEGMLVFDIALKEWEDSEEPPPPPPPPEVPEDVAAPPKDATTTASGLAYKVLKKGEGTEHPTAKSQVSCHYSGWTTDGKMFDSSVARGRPSTFGLGQVIKGWTEGVQLMVAGDKYRFWIPVELAYSNAPGKPAGMLVFDIDLIEIK